MARPGVGDQLRPKRPPESRRVAPAPLRVGLIGVVAGLIAAAVGGADGFWLCLPAGLLAAAVAHTTRGGLWSAAPVWLVGAAAAAAVQRAVMPPLWLALFVPAACLLVTLGTGGRLRRERDALQNDALSDPLTGLANRRLLMSMAEYEVARHRRADARFTVVMLDLDGFKPLNDRHGHAAGDQMLRDVAAALTRALRSQDTIARFGGDEFCVIAPETEHPRVLAARIAAAVSEAANGSASLSASVGLAVFPEDGTTIELLLRAADDRLLEAKRRLYGAAERRAA
jgi:diguanylate cyclase (GGDEF)-like protein